jgi:hypothetical protein
MFRKNIDAWGNFPEKYLLSGKIITFKENSEKH